MPATESDQEGTENRPPQGQEDLVRLLPDDVLAAVLSRLAPRDLAASRCARKAWRAIVDDRRLLLPRKVVGIFIDFNCLSSWEFFARPTAGSAISGELDFLLPDARSSIQDHCNGLLLGYNGVLNPATGGGRACRRARLLLMKRARVLPPRRLPRVRSHRITALRGGINPKNCIQELQSG
ncbi:hypothetical protein C2845_PM02G03170 [Panicum miliaceum]|uniref:F-box domain-containing protein n=1 Tax=Panicum miliaceum TaxID=4540 RepID=A0A3L6SGN8_PANMI|nr:hypothetical protein C2845_PM02G03170 [Panicum miliaceum]